MMRVSDKLWIGGLERRKGGVGNPRGRSSHVKGLKMRLQRTGVGAYVHGIETQIEPAPQISRQHEMIQWVETTLRWIRQSTYRTCLQPCDRHFSAK